MKEIDLEQLIWPAERLGEAIEITALRVSLVSSNLKSLSDSEMPALPAGWDESSLTQWIDTASARLGIEAEPMEATLSEINNLVRKAAPAILRLPQSAYISNILTKVTGSDDLNSSERNQAHFLVLLSSGSRCKLLGADLQEYPVHPAFVRDQIYLPLVAPWISKVDELLSKTNVPEERRSAARLLLMEQQFASIRTNMGWMLRVSPGSDLLVQARLNQLLRPVLAFLGAYTIQTGLQIFSWWFIGQGVLGGQMNSTWLWAWALLLFTAIPFQLLVSWSQGYLSIMAGAIFKQRLLYGALKMKPDELRMQGMGQFLGRVMESDSIETLALNGGILAVMALVQLGTAAIILSQGAGGMLHLSVLIIWVTGILFTGWSSYLHGRVWTETYRNMTNNLVERMVGHRTRLAQESPKRWHAGEDQELGRYQDLSAKYDRNGVIFSIFPSSWLIVGLGCLIPAFLANPIDMTKLAVSLGGVMLAYQAFGAIQSGIQSIIQLRLTWGQIQPLFKAASQTGDPEGAGERTSPTVILNALQKAKKQIDDPGISDEIVPADVVENEFIPNESNLGNSQEIIQNDYLRKLSPLMVVRKLNFRYRERGRLVLHDCDLQIFDGDRILLEGSSGGGKSTLAAVLAGLRKAETGALLLHGYDRQSLGADAWRKRVVIAPQFHENHIFSETFAFNILMGRNWPPTPQDMDEAAAICSELGLGDLIRRMPSSWQQMVGENGWQLSHGERSRVFIARALLQNADLIIMDESFGALDPENLYLSLKCVRQRASTLLVIAHP